ncbi:unnamed protein product [Bursaphelenchus okinawaensis]|uniref:Uncharacterized protein n=1 Tax=Bursaphelenchus okinawaensis TaxID=465554 RepID=A0A811L5Y0_9BILA|nr:unnamed protein product [Bursaphelenchus okinawaensis]CAG9117238.1 unnamed protein product [Bursaphelenchus okinawaensis]
MYLLCCFFVISAVLLQLHAQQYPRPESVQRQLNAYYGPSMGAVASRPLSHSNAVLEEVSQAYPQYNAKRLLSFLVDKYKRDLASNQAVGWMSESGRTFAPQSGFYPAVAVNNQPYARGFVSSANRAFADTNGQAFGGTNNQAYADSNSQAFAGTNNQAFSGVNDQTPETAPSPNTNSASLTNPQALPNPQALTNPQNNAQLNENVSPMTNNVQPVAAVEQLVPQKAVQVDANMEKQASGSPASPAANAAQPVPEPLSTGPVASYAPTARFLGYAPMSNFFDNRLNAFAQ